MAFAGFPAVADQLLEQILPLVGAIAAVAPIDDNKVESGMRRSQIWSESCPKWDPALRLPREPPQSSKSMNF